MSRRIYNFTALSPQNDNKILLLNFFKRSTHGRWQRGGNASNNSTVISLLGEKCEILSSFSTSEMFKFVIHDLTVHDIEHKNCVYHDNCEVPLSSIWLSEETGSRTVVHSNPNLPHISFDGFDKCTLDEYKWIHFEVGWVSVEKCWRFTIDLFHYFTLRRVDYRWNFVG